MEALFYGLLIAIIWGAMLYFDILILKEDGVDGFTFSAVKIITLAFISVLLIIIYGLRNSFEDINLSNKRSVKYMLIAGFTGWVVGTIIVYSTLTIPNVILLESFLSFLGLGIQPPQSSWGLLISYGVETMEEYPWLLIFPAVALSLTLFSLNFLGDGLRDALDPKASKD